MWKAVDNNIRCGASIFQTVRAVAHTAAWKYASRRDQSRMTEEVKAMYKKHSKKQNMGGPGRMLDTEPALDAVLDQFIKEKRFIDVVNLDPNAVGTCMLMYLDSYLHVRAGSEPVGPYAKDDAHSRSRRMLQRSLLGSGRLKRGAQEQNTKEEEKHREQRQCPSHQQPHQSADKQRRLHIRTQRCF